MSKHLLFASRKAYKAPRFEFVEQLPEEMLCTSSDGFTEGFGEIDDFTW